MARCGRGGDREGILKDQKNVKSIHGNGTLSFSCHRDAMEGKDRKITGRDLSVMIHDSYWGKKWHESMNLSIKLDGSLPLTFSKGAGGGK